MPWCPTDMCETCGCCMEISCITHGCHGHSSSGEADPQRVEPVSVDEMTWERMRRGMPWRLEIPADPHQAPTTTDDDDA